MNPTSFKFACPKCGQHLTAETEHIGQSIGCPSCGELITVPKPMTVAAASPPPAMAPGYRQPVVSGGQMTADKTYPKGLVLAGWLMIGVTCLVSLIPGIGFLTWLIAGPILLVTFVLGVVALSKGATTQGILILLASVIGAPVFLVVAPIVTTALAVGGAAASADSGQAKVEPGGTSKSGEVAGGGRPDAPGAARRAATIGDEIRFDDATWVVVSARELGSSLKGGTLAPAKTTEGNSSMFVSKSPISRTKRK